MLIEALRMLGEYDQALRAVERAREQYPEHIALCLRWHSETLAALGRIGEMNRVLDELEATENVVQISYGLWEPVEWPRFYGYSDAACAAAERAIQWHEARPAEEKATSYLQLNYGRVLFLAGRPDEAQTVFDAMVVDFPDDGYARVSRAFVAAVRGDTAQALSDAAWFEDLPDPKFSWWPRGVIYGALGDRERAMGLFRRAFQSRWSHGAWQDHIRVEHEAMRGYPPFEELLRPKG